MIEALKDTYEKLIIGILAVQYFFVNIIFTTYTQNIVMLKDLTAPFFSLLVFALWVCGDLAKYGRWNLPRNGVVPAMVGALLYWIIPTISGTSTAYAVELWGRMFCYFIQTWAAMRFINTFERMGFFLKIIVVTNVLIVGYGFTQLMGHDLLVELGVIPDWGSLVFVSTHGNQNFLAGYLVDTFPVIIGYWFITRNPVLLFVLPLLVLLNIYEVVESTARGAYLGCAFGLSFFFIALVLNRKNLHFIKDERWKKVGLILAALAVVGIIAGGVVKREKIFALPEKVYSEFYSILEFETNYTNWVRLIFFQMALDGALRDPVIGRGLGSFNWKMPETRVVWYHRTGVSHNTDHPHNEHLEWLHDAGTLGLTVFWWVLAAYFWTGVREIWRHRRGYHFPLVVGTFVAPWMQWIQGTFDVETRWTGNGVTLWFTLGFALAFANLPVLTGSEEKIDVRPEIQKQKSKRKNFRESLEYREPHPYLATIAGLFAALILFYTVKAVDFWRADHHLRNNMGFTDANVGNVENAIREAELAQNLSYATVSIYYKLAYSYLMAGRLDYAMDAYRELQSFAPNYAQIHINLAFLNDQMGYKTSSAFERERAAAIEHNVRNHRDAASYWLQLGYPMRAIAHLHYCFTIERERTESSYIYWYEYDNLHTELARIYASIGKNDLALFSAKQAIDFNPENISAVLLLNDLSANNPLIREEVRKKLANYTANNPALAVMKMNEDVAAKNYDEALNIAEQIANILPLPSPQNNNQVLPEVQFLGNSLLQALQTMFTAKYKMEKCLEIAGWIYACQGRFSEADNFLAQSYAATKDPRIADRLAQVRARIK